MASAIGGAISGFGKIKKGKQMERAGQQGIDNFEWQDLANPYKDLAISTAGTDLATDNLATNTATAVNALRSGGTRGVVGGVGRVQANANQVNKELAANLDMQQKNKDFAAAGQDVNNQNTMDIRQGNELAGYGNMMDVGMDMQTNGMGDLVAAGGAIDSFAMSALTGGMSGVMGKRTPQPK